VIALTHHERWDGSGYPRGLKGEEIPISGRICALADVFDALTTKRPYKAEIAVNDALKMIQEASGKFFDPILVKVFAENFDRIIEIRKLNI
jgi:putative two-component system response regulator